MCIPFFHLPCFDTLPKNVHLYPLKTTEATSGFCLRPEVPPSLRALQSDGEVFDVKALSDLTLAERQRLLCLGAMKLGTVSCQHTEVVKALC